ncbi:uncharacterized protein LOC110876779 [Helianthus annuus]|uniref:uncharacterized protein LOC110876779 n=1 Tax=Helianthus annuus TaxID=4232 RepID=UPI000B90260F|nr:uncharacterized protein LOC110876779 [Helianthus annuus]
MTNIQNKVHPLDDTKVTYSSWVKLFKLHAKAYKVLDHIDGTTAPKEGDDEYDSWQEIDALILQWIYPTLSDEYLVRVLETDTTARATWAKLEGIFINNKGSRATTLEHDFTNLTLGACASLDEYCQKLKDIADQRGDVGFLVSEPRLVMQLVRGPPSEYDVTAALINQTSPTWDEARTSLQKEQQRQAARQNNNQSILVTTMVPAATTTEPPTQPNNPPVPNTAPTNHNRYPPNFYGPNRPRGRGRGYRGGRGRGYRGRDNYPNSHWNQPSPNYHPTYGPQQPPPLFPSWNTPPTPYPSQAWAPNQPLPTYPQAQYNQAHLAYQQAQMQQLT